MRSLSSTVKSVFQRLDRFSQILHRPQSTITTKAEAEPAALANNDDRGWLAFPPAYTSHLTKTISVLYENYDAFHTTAGDFLDLLTSIHNRECNLAATFAADMRKLDSRSFRAGYDIMVLEEVTAPLEAIEEHQDAVKAKLKRLQAPIDPKALVTTRLTDVLDIYDLFVASYQQLESVNAILTRARRLTTTLVPVEVQRTSGFTLKLLFDTCYSGAMILHEGRWLGKPSTGELIDLAYRLQIWDTSIFDTYPCQLDELFALDTDSTRFYRRRLVSDFLCILIFVGEHVITPRTICLVVLD